jgi:hypothetical protein
MSIIFAILIAWALAITAFLWLWRAIRRSERVLPAAPDASLPPLGRTTRLGPPLERFAAPLEDEG